MKTPNLNLSLAAPAIFVAYPAVAHEGHEHGQKKALTSGETKKVTGAVIDMASYSITTRPARNADCAKKCITSNLPLALKANNGKLRGQQPLNSKFAQYAAKKITAEGKVTCRDGIYMLENAVIQK